MIWTFMASWSMTPSWCEDEAVDRGAQTLTVHVRSGGLDDFDKGQSWLAVPSFPAEKGFIQ